MRRKAGSRETAKPPTLAGSWRIRQSEAWSAKALDLLGPAVIHFGPHQLGELRMIAIQADLDYRTTVVDGNPRVEFSWQGFDDNDPACGRGWAEMDSDSLRGCLFIHRGDESTFRAVRYDEGREPAKTQKKRRKVISEGEGVLVSFTEAEMRLITDQTSADPEYMSRLQPAGKGRSGFTGLFTLDDLEDLIGYIAAEANHTDDKGLRGRLYRLFDRLTAELESYDDGNWQGPL